MKFTREFEVAEAIVEPVVLHTQRKGRHYIGTPSDDFRDLLNMQAIHP